MSRYPLPEHGRRQGAGSRPALVVVDFSRGFTDPASRLACDADAAVAVTARLLTAARSNGVPVVYTTVAYDEAAARVAAAFIAKSPALLELRIGSRWVEIDPRIAPEPGEPVLSKLFASAFFGTPLASLLAAAGCDTTVIVGASTSGCVRATAVDALQHGYRVVVPRDAVADRLDSAHEATLFDLDAKYADVVDGEAAAAILAGSHPRHP